jgi:hypothetical protein
MEIPERDSVYLTSFMPRYRTFFESLLENGIDLNWVLRYANLLKTPNLVQETIPSLVSQLQQFTVTPEQATHPEVRYGREILRRFFELKQPILRKYDIIPFVYGSLLYDDPHHLDYDIVLFGQHFVPEVQQLATIYWPDEINELGSNDREVQLTYTTLQQIEAFVELFSDDTHVHKINTAAFDIQCLMADVSIVFSGSPIIDNDTSLLPALRERCTMLMHQEPLVAAVAVYDFQDTLRVRQERRGL